MLLHSCSHFCFQHPTMNTYTAIVTMNTYTAIVLTLVLAVTAGAALPKEDELISTLEEEFNSLIFELNKTNLVQEQTAI